MRLICGLLLAAALHAQDMPFERAALNMLPGVSQETRGKLHYHYNRAAGEVKKVAAQIRKLDAQLRRKPGSEELRAERAKLATRHAQLHAALEERLRKAGLDDAQLARLKRMPRGALREERYNHGVLLEVEDLGDAQRDLLEHLVAATDAAQAAVVEQKAQLLRGLDGEDRLLRRRVASTCDQQCRAMEKRFWRVAYYVLRPSQMRAARKLFSPQYARVPQDRQQFYALPGMRPSQANRLRALFAEFDSECAADQATMRRNYARLRAKGVTKEERTRLYRENAAANRRVQDLIRRTRTAVFAHLEPEQAGAYRALPPLLNIGERGRAPWELAKGARLATDRRRRLVALQKETSRLVRGERHEHKDVSEDMAKAGLGAESPQMMAMETMRQRVRGRITDRFREAGQRLVLDVLEPEQLVDWIVGTSV